LGQNVKFSLYRISQYVYSGFGLGRFHCVFKKVVGFTVDLQNGSQTELHTYKLKKLKVSQTLMHIEKSYNKLVKLGYTVTENGEVTDYRSMNQIMWS
jgi:hypothetical protein